MPAGITRRGFARGELCPKCGGDEWYIRVRQTKPSCKQCHRRMARESKHRRSGPRRLFESARQRAAVLGVDFHITTEDIARVWPGDNRCPALGLELRHGRGTLGDASPTLDRLNPAWGYEPDNIAVISYAANRAKSNLTADELERIAHWMKTQGLS